MSSVVLDASVTSAWVFPDESDLGADAILDAIEDGVHDGLVPVHWFLEMCNSLVMGVRRGRIAREDVAEYLLDLSSLDLITDTEADLNRAIELAMRYGLTVYDAVYLELALRARVPIATLDSRLRRAASETGVEVLT